MDKRKKCMGHSPGPILLVVSPVYISPTGASVEAGLALMVLFFFFFKIKKKLVIPSLREVSTKWCQRRRMTSAMGSFIEEAAFELDLEGVGQEHSGWKQQQNKGRVRECLGNCRLFPLVET